MPEKNNFPNLNIINHPVIQDRLTRARNKNTQPSEFKKHVKKIAMLMTYEVTKHLEVQQSNIETPMASFIGQQLKNREPIIVPILRAGLGFSDGVQEILSESDFAHIGVYRDEDTKKPVEYLVRMPPDMKDKDVLLVDPMLATGHSADHAIKLLKEAGVDAKRIKFMVLVAAPEGVQFLQENQPEVEVFTAALDDHLNEDCYIVPGLGDAGDRIFGT